MLEVCVCARVYVLPSLNEAQLYSVRVCLLIRERASNELHYEELSE